MSIKIKIVETPYKNGRVATFPEGNCEDEFTLHFGRLRLAFSRVGEVRFGPAYYRVSVAGEDHPALSKFFNGKFFLSPDFNDNYSTESKCHFNPEKKLLALKEFSQLESKEFYFLHILNIETGKDQINLPDPKVQFYGWRPGKGEFLYSRVKNDFNHWGIIDEKGQDFPLTKKGDYPMISADGKWFFLFSSTFHFIKVFNLEKRTLEDENSAAFLKDYGDGKVLHFEAENPKEPSMEICLLDQATSKIERTYKVTLEKLPS